MEKQSNLGFADLAVSHRRIKSTFFEQMNLLLDWQHIEIIIKKHYNKGVSVAGRPSYPGILLFKMTLLQTWYGLSDYEVEDQVKDRISFSRFVGVSMEEDVPDHSVISRFRSELTRVGAYDKLFQEVNRQLEKHHILLRSGAIVDASITDSPRKPRGKKEYQAVEDRNEETGEVTTKAVEQIQSHVDTDAAWIKKRNKLRYGFKQHTATDENGLVLNVVTTAANESDISHLEDVLDNSKLIKGASVKADKGYKSQKNDEMLKEKGYRNRILRKASKNRSLTPREIQFNKLVSRTRYRVERTFGSMRRWFGAGTARYVGLAKMHTQHLMEAIAYNLYRSPRIIASLCEQ